MSKIEPFYVTAFFLYIHRQTNMNISWDLRAYATVGRSSEQVVNYAMHSRPEFTDPNSLARTGYCCFCYLTLISQYQDLCMSSRPYPGESYFKFCRPSINRTSILSFCNGQPAAFTQGLVQANFQHGSVWTWMEWGLLAIFWSPT